MVCVSDVYLFRKTEDLVKLGKIWFISHANLVKVKKKKEIKKLGQHLRSSKNPTDYFQPYSFFKV